MTRERTKQCNLNRKLQKGRKLSRSIHFTYNRKNDILSKVIKQYFLYFIIWLARVTENLSILYNIKK